MTAMTAPKLRWNHSADGGIHTAETATHEYRVRKLGRGQWEIALYESDGTDLGTTVRGSKADACGWCDGHFERVKQQIANNTEYAAKLKSR